MEAVLDDGDLLKDRLLRSFHRNRDGHLSVFSNRHTSMVQNTHNCALIYVYLQYGHEYAVADHYVYSHTPHTYKYWRNLVYAELETLEENPPDQWYGAYGWLTSTIQITPLRTGDLFVAIDASGARGVRISFDTGTNQRKAHNEKVKSTRRRKRNRLR
jgi:hypothetical protein